MFVGSLMVALLMALPLVGVGMVLGVAIGFWWLLWGALAGLGLCVLVWFASTLIVSWVYSASPIMSQTPARGGLLLERLFRKPRLSAEKREAILAYLKREALLTAKRDEVGDMFNRAMAIWAPCGPDDASANEAMAAAALQTAAAFRDAVTEHSNIVGIPDEAGACYMTWHSTDLALSRWAEAASAVYAGVVHAGILDQAMQGMAAKDLFAEAVRLMGLAQKEQLRLMKSIKMTADELRELDKLQR
jgi:hypothetical protein